MGNAEIIDDLVSKQALESLAELDGKLQGTYDVMEKVLAKCQELAGAFTTMNKPMSEMAKTAEAVVGTTKDFNDVCEEQKQIITAQAKVMQDAVKATKEQNQVMLSNLKTTQQVDDLIRKTLNTREKNIELLAEEREELKAVTRLQQENNKAEAEQKKGIQEAAIERERLLSLELKHKQTISELQIILRNEEKILQANEGSHQKLRLELERMRMAYRKLTDDIKQSDVGKELFASINEFDSAVKASSESVGNFQESVGNYGKGFKDISRILMMVNPELGRYASRIQSVTAVKDVWNKANNKLVTSLNLSTKAARALMFTGVGVLIAGIAALITIYQKWKEKQEEINRIQKEFADIELNTAKAMVEQKMNVEALLSVANNYNASLELRNEAVKRLNELMPDYNAYIDREGKLIGDSTTALYNYLEAIYKVEKAKELFSKMKDTETEIETLKQKGSEGLSTMKWYQEVESGLLNMIDGTNKLFGVQSNNLDSYLEEISQKGRESWIEQLNNLKQLLNAQKEEFDKIISEPAVFTAVFGNPTTAGKTTKTSSKTTAKTANKQIDEEMKAYQQMVLFKMKLEADAQKEISSDTEKAYVERHAAYVAYHEKQIVLIEKQREFELQNEKLTQSGRELINLQADEKILESKRQLDKSILELEKGRYDKLYKDAQEYFQNIEALNAKEEQKELVELSKRYAEGALKKEEYEKAKLAIAKQYAVWTFEEEITYLEKQLKEFEKDADLQEQIVKQLAKAKEDYAKYAANAEIKANEESVKAQKSAYESLKEYLNTEYSKTTQDVWNSMTDIANMYYDEQLSRIDELEKREREYYDERLKMIDENVQAGLMSEEEADARRRILEETQLQREKEFEQQRREMQRKQAVWQKANAIIQAMVNTGVAFTSALGMFPPPLGIAMAAIVGALGAAQVAMIASKSIPSYARGTSNHPGGLAVVGDAGRSEMVVTPSGGVWKTPARDTLALLPKGAEVFPDFKKAFTDMFSLPKLPVYDDRNGEVFRYDDSALQKNTSETNNRLGDINRNLGALRANSRYSDKKAYLMYKLNQYSRYGY